MMKNINIPGGPTLEEYYNSVIVNEWTPYTGQTLPDDVVMLVGCTPDVPQGGLVRIDYDVVIELPEGADALYTNDAEPLPLTKEPPQQYHPLTNGVPVEFDVYFTAPLDATVFRSFTVNDILHPSLALNAAGSGVTAYPATPVAHTMSYDTTTNTVSFEIENTVQTAGKLIIVHIAATVADTTLIPTLEPYGIPGFYNTASLTINDNPDITSESEPVLVLFSIPEPVPVPIVKAPPTQTKDKLNGTPVIFELTFDAPAEMRVYRSFTVTDALHPALAANEAGTSVTALPDADVPFGLTYDSASGLVTIAFENTALTAGRTIRIVLAATVADAALIPPSNVIENRATLTLNGNPQIYSDSNTVTVTPHDIGRRAPPRTPLKGLF